MGANFDRRDLLNVEDQVYEILRAGDVLVGDVEQVTRMTAARITAVWTQAAAEQRRRDMISRTDADRRTAQQAYLDSLGELAQRKHELDNVHTSLELAYHQIERLERDTAALLEALEAAERIVGKVIADDLMPDIAAPGYPILTHERMLAAIAQAKGETT